MNEIHEALSKAYEDTEWVPGDWVPGDPPYDHPETLISITADFCVEVIYTKSAILIQPNGEDGLEMDGTFVWPESSRTIDEVLAAVHKIIEKGRK